MLPEHKAIFTPPPSHRNSSKSDFSFCLTKNKQLNHVYGQHEKIKPGIQPENTKNLSKNGPGAISACEYSYIFNSNTPPYAKSAFTHQPCTGARPAAQAG